MKPLTLCLSLVAALASVSVGQDWQAFRGDGRSYAPQANTPAEFDVETGKNIAWRVDTSGRGIGGPLVIGDQIIVTGCAGEDERDLYVESYSTKDGALQWSRPMRATGRPFTHPTSSNASPTPASDGQRIFALFSSCDLICYDLQGHLLWYRAIAMDHPKTGNDISMSSSPVVSGDTVVVQLQNQGDSFAAGIDTATGAYRWTNERTAASNWSSPSPIKLDDGTDAVLMHDRSGIDIVEAQRGNVVKHFDISGDGTASSTYANPYIVVPGQNTTAFRLTSAEAKGDAATAVVEWESSRLRPQRCSPVISEDRVYMGKGSVLVAGSLSDGSVLWQARLGKLGGVWATPVLTKTGIYVIDSEGKTIVVSDQGSKGEVIGRSEVGEKVLASPAVSGNALYLRTENGLMKIASS